MASVYLDTHVVMWLHSGDTSFISPHAREAIDQGELWISPMVLLELQYLFDLKKLHIEPGHLIENLGREIGVRVCAKAFQAVVESALKLYWTRDPFDRIITAHAALDSNTLITKDSGILKHYSKAVW